MNIPFSSVCINNCKGKRETIRESWESDFEKNQNTFAESIAYRIAKQSIFDLRKTISPYNKPISSKNKFVSNISFEITKSENAKNIITLIEDYRKLPPFNGWLDKFSVVTNKSNERSSYIDQSYFDKKMTIITELVKIKLEELFSQYKIENFYFKVEWLYKKNQQPIHTSDSKACSLRIQLWFDNNEILIEQIEKKGLTTIELSTERQKELQKIDLIDNFIKIIVVSLFISIFALQWKFYNGDLKG